MSTDHTQQQSSEEQRQARDLSLDKARPPAEIPGYTLQRMLGCGAYGEVWIGIDRNTNRRVAIKFYTHRSGVDWTLLSREVEKLVYLSADRYVVQLLDVGWEAEPPYYVMDYIQNGSLEDLLRRQGTLPMADAIEMFEEVAVGLMHAHGKGVLHCDLKPANILLDEDQKPRLADFGQSRLSHEQSPALGTLFYMAPEQADLKALPDARWDVYALGAIVYCMLTGQPPYRSEEGVRDIESAKLLSERLQRYRNAIRSAPPLTIHRRIRGVDRALAEIIERCLAVDPSQRFANVQAILDALNVRAQRRLRRPLVLLGFVGPVLLLLIMALFGLRGYEHAMSESEDVISLRARESNDFAAKFAARSLEGEIERYFRLLRNEVASQELHAMMVPVVQSEIVQQLNTPNQTAEEVRDQRTEFLADSSRHALNEYLEQRLSGHLQRLEADPGDPKFASIFVLDKQGRMLAVAYDKPQIDTRSVGWNYAYRTYFHGGPADLSEFSKTDLPQNVKPLESPHLSAAFLSTTTGTWKVAVSAPIYQTGDVAEPVGVLAMTLNLGDFAYFRSNYRPDRFAVLVDGRQGPNRGVILQHPLFDAMRRGNTMAGSPSSTTYRLQEEQLRRILREKWYRYQDPMQHAQGGAAYAGDWIAAIDNVRLPYASPDHRDMIVLVQEKYHEATTPVKQLGQRLKREAIWAISGVTAVIMILWYIVLRMLQEPHAAYRRTVSRIAPPSTHDGMTTLPAPAANPKNAE